MNRTAGTKPKAKDRGDIDRPIFPRTTIEQVRGSAGYRGPTVPIVAFDQGIVEYIRELWEDVESQPRPSRAGYQSRRTP